MSVAARHVHTKELSEIETEKESQKKGEQEEKKFELKNTTFSQGTGLAQCCFYMHPSINGCLSPLISAPRVLPPGTRVSLFHKNVHFDYN